MSQLRDVIEHIGGVNDADGGKAVAEKYDFGKILNDVSDEDWSDVRRLVVVCLESDYDVILQVDETIFQRPNLIQWKDHREIFDSFFDTLTSVGTRAVDATSQRWTRTLRSILQSLVELLKKLKLLSGYTGRFQNVIVVALNSKENRLAGAVTKIVDKIEWHKEPEKIKEVIERSYDVMAEYPMMPHTLAVAQMMVDVFHGIFQTMWPTGRAYTKAAAAIADVVTKVFNHCMDASWEDPNDREKLNVNYYLCKTILKDYYTWHRNETKILKPVFGKILSLRKSEEVEMKELVDELLSTMEENLAELMGDQIDFLIDQFIEDPTPPRAYQLSEAIAKKPRAFKPRVNDIAKVILESDDTALLKDGMYAVLEMAKKVPMQFSTETIAKIAENLGIHETTLQHGPLCLEALAKIRRADVMPHDDAMIAVLYTNYCGLSVTIMCMLVKFSTEGKEYAAKYLQAFVDTFHKSSTIAKQNLLYQMSLIGAKYPEELAKHKAFFEECEKDPSVQQYTIWSVNIIENRSLEAVSKGVSERKEEIKQVDVKTSKTEKRVDKAEDDVKQIDESVSAVVNDVAEQAEKLEELEEVVEETVEKVEEIDKKTLSHAPVWSRDVAKLLNPEAEYDWRYLATRLGYSNDDISNWATQPDPCLSLLDEWFATHRTRDATFAVEQALNEMNRVDAAMIVENALKQTEGVVEEDDTEEWDPPPIFISYQWGHQQEVKLLHKHLEMAGYKSWMDIGQMGGGDKLFAKIDQGIRAAKVVICCVSEKYAKSANCNREVNLSVTLGKPMIPLLMEKLSWPPPGSMGPIFGEYIFVRFFARPGETAGDEGYWPTAKFQELLMQIRFTHAPDPAMITSDLYRDWWSPPEEIIVIKPKDEKEQALSHKTEEQQEEEMESPEVFISYQWGKQPQIKKLYKTLSAKGYVCWLDIMQMGGGDSLYDKIDKGIRGCQVVVSCVTSKYALSANCRREVSLADALKKPIVPLLLEDTTWPPAGPMSMVFTQLLYIDFCKPDIDVQNTWTCPQMDQLYDKLVTHIPRMKPLEPIKITKEDRTLNEMNSKNDTKPDSCVEQPGPVKSHDGGNNNEETRESVDPNPIFESSEKPTKDDIELCSSENCQDGGDEEVETQKRPVNPQRDSTPDVTTSTDALSNERKEKPAKEAAAKSSSCTLI